MQFNPSSNVSQIRAAASHYAFSALSGALFVASLAFNGYYTGHDAANGGLLLAFGWFGLASWEIAWLANPVLLMAAVHYKRRQYQQAKNHSLVSIGLMLSFLFTGKVVVSEAPTYAEVTGYGLGYVLWVCSAVVLLAGAMMCRRNAQRAA